MGKLHLTWRARQSDTPNVAAVHICFYAVQSRKKAPGEPALRLKGEGVPEQAERWHKIDAAQHFITGATPMHVLSKHSETGRPA